MSNKTQNLTDKYAYYKKVVTDKVMLESLLINHIQQICHEMGYKLIEIKIEKTQ